MYNNHDASIFLFAVLGLHLLIKHWTRLKYSEMMAVSYFRYLMNIS